MRSVYAGLAAVALAAGPAMAKDRAAVKIDCKETQTGLVYECLLHLSGKKSKMPIDGATVAVKPDMPTMPGAHNIPAATAAPTGKPGAYGFRMQLDMYGIWALKITVTGPLRDIVVQKIEFRK
ncbi:MAG: FixH family protein [Rhodospirillaceae bacterium]|nr:FixH family protein [Rhodospirillaceae bacterium]